MTEFIRIFHPVGQGAFYSENFRFKRSDGSLSEYCVVYDCGSKRGKNWLKTKISSACPNKKVNLLFLSHFHDDHYKGIELLEPEIIILPLLNEWDKVIFWLGHELKKTSFDKDYEDTLRQKFPAARIIRIKPSGEEHPQSDGAKILYLEPLQSDSLDNVKVDEMPSGSILSLPMLKDWIYIPVNPKLDSKLIERFQELLNKEPELDKKELLKLDSNYFQAHKNKLKRIYENIGNPNEYSMAVYSGPNRFTGNDAPIKIDAIYHHPICCHRFHGRNRVRCVGICNYIRYHVNSGCLYLGDINLKETDLKHFRVLENIYKSLPAWIEKDLSTIQVPHHGSIENYNSSLKYYYDSSTKDWREWRRPIIYVISVGVWNNYGHPSSYVVSDLMRCINHVVLVTDESESMFIEKFRY